MNSALKEGTLSSIPGLKIRNKRDNAPGVFHFWGELKTLKVFGW